MARYHHHFGSSWRHMVTTVCVNLITEGEASGLVAVGISKQWQWLQQPPHPFLARSRETSHENPGEMRITSALPVSQMELSNEPISVASPSPLCHAPLPHLLSFVAEHTFLGYFHCMERVARERGKKPTAKFVLGVEGVKAAFFYS